MREPAGHPFRVILVAPQLTCWGLERLIESGAPGFEHLASVARPADLEDLAVLPEADALVMDLDGVPPEGLIDRIARWTAARVVLVTGCQDEATLDHAVISGVHGIVGRDDAPQVLLKALDRVCSGELWIDRGATSRIFMDLMRRKAHEKSDPELARIRSLTLREREMIRAVARETGAPGKVIAQHLCISEHTLRNHLSSIYGKLGLSNRLELFAFATRHRQDLLDARGSQF